MNKGGSIFKSICILVTYNPNIASLNNALLTIKKNDVDILVIDNCSINYSEIKNLSSKIQFIGLDKNYGIAMAQNIGIDFALKNQYKYLWFSDQDTIYSNDFLDQMLCNIRDIQQKKIKFAAIGPKYIGKEDQLSFPFVRIKKQFEYFIPETGLNECSQIISSGMIVPADVFATIGFMNENFFIDYVDLEWCWRARKQGYKIFGVGDISIIHQLGDKTVKFFKKNIQLRSPARSYFITRNMLYIIFHTRLINFRCKLQILRYETLNALATLIICKRRIQYMRNIFKGLLHGIVGKLSA